MESGEYYVDVAELPPHVKRVEVEQLDGDIPGLSCMGCGHEWKNRVEQPTQCPDCHAKIMWDEPDAMVLAESDVMALAESEETPDVGSSDDDSDEITLNDLLDDE